MRFLITMNMPSAQGFLVHQLTIEHQSQSCSEFCDELQGNEFIIGRLLYRQKTMTGETLWIDRGDVIINTSHVGKAQEFLDIEREDYDEPYRTVEQRRGYVERKGPVIRSSR
jgi:hypothetical protein